MIEVHTDRVNEFNDVLSKITDTYQVYTDIIDADLINDLTSFSRSFQLDVSSAINKDRKLRIGVVGQVNAGKSSFLNALLFNGKNVLPRAATPMTAALTVVSYSETPYFEIEFYTKEEWDNIQRQASCYDDTIKEARKRLSNKNPKDSHNCQVKLTDEEIAAIENIPSDILAAKTLVTSFKNSKRNLNDCLGQTVKIDAIDTVDDLLGKLFDYVGADGDFTPITKISYLFIPLEEIRDIEIVDTPGINDPIYSRGQKTKKWLGRCDVVFLLSYSGQFMDTSDVELLLHNMPGKGINNVLLLGSKFDSVLLDEAKNYRSLKGTIRGTSTTLEEHAQRTIEPKLKEQPNNKVLEGLKKCLPPSFISSIAFTIAINFNNRDETEEHVLKQLQKRFPNNDFNPSLLKNLSNIEGLKANKLINIVDEKEAILKEKLDNLLEGQKFEFINLLQEIQKLLEVNLDRLENMDRADLQKTKKHLLNGIRETKANVERVFEEMINAIVKKLNKLKINFKEEAKKYRNINIRTETKEVFVRTERYGFLWLKKRDVTKNVKYTKANIHNAIEQLNDFAFEAEKEIHKEFDEIINIKQLRKDLIKSVLYFIDTGHENFNKGSVTRPVEKTANSITIPSFEFDVSQYENKVLQAFNDSDVEGDDVSKLERMHFNLLNDLLKEILNKMTSKIQEIHKKLSLEGDNYIKNIVKYAEEELEFIKRMMDDRDKNIHKTKNLLVSLKSDIEKVNKLN